MAQRVWPMPKVPWMGLVGDDGFEVAELAGGSAELRVPSGPPATAMPAES